MFDGVKSASRIHIVNVFVPARSARQQHRKGAFLARFGAHSKFTTIIAPHGRARNNKLPGPISVYHGVPHVREPCAPAPAHFNDIAPMQCVVMCLCWVIGPPAPADKSNMWHTHTHTRRRPYLCIQIQATYIPKLAASACSR